MRDGQRVWWLLIGGALVATGVAVERWGETSRAARSGAIAQLDADASPERHDAAGTGDWMLDAALARRAER